MSTLLGRLKLALLLLLSVVLAGTIGYHIAADLSWLDALYQTVVTITTVGYSDLAQDPAVRPFTILMIAVGTVTIAVLISLITGVVVESQLRDMLGRQKVENTIRKMNDHVVLCGFGRFGRTAATQLERKKRAFVVLETDHDHAEQAADLGYLVLRADATEEESLTRAGIERASSLLTTLDTDAANVYVTLTAKQMNRALRVVALAHDEHAGPKLKAAGADEIVSPYQLGGNWLAQVVTSPHVADVMKMATGVNPLDFFMEEQVIRESSPLAGVALMETTIRADLGVIVVAVKRGDGSLLTNPPPDTTLEAGDVLVSLGPQERLDRLKELAAGN